ncbi:MAG: hypothetical protein F4103_07240 [Boseongicola sp. SB0673_bin_14]|nr:hypothetical protein [Gammaproteobacteria bacterium]MYI68534.1 hypothetical protein [Boseongicola sp. SB0673_bin_14]
MSGAIVLSGQLREDIDETRRAYRKACGHDIGVGGLLENALSCYRDQLMDAVRRSGGKSDAEDAHD